MSAHQHPPLSGISIGILSFSAGALVAAALLLPAALTPDYHRGHADGYKAGWLDGTGQCENQYRLGVEDGIRHAHETRSTDQE